MSNGFTWESQKLKLKEISTIRVSRISDCLICEERRTGGTVLYTVLRVRDHDVARALLSLYEMEEVPGSALIDSFSAEGNYIFVYPYEKERPLARFYRGDVLSLTECEDICTNVILCCMTSGLPWPLLYLVLQQGLLNLERDGSVNLSYSMDLSDLDLNKKEKDCTVACARIIMELLESRASEKPDSYLLLQKKTANMSYSRFTELYRDIRIAAAPKHRLGFLRRFRSWFISKKDTIFGILFWVSLGLGIFALALFLTSLTLGDIPWLRLFINSFRNIGTESLLQ